MCTIHVQYDTFIIHLFYTNVHAHIFNDLAIKGHIENVAKCQYNGKALHRLVSRKISKRNTN